MSETQRLSTPPPQLHLCSVIKDMRGVALGGTGFMGNLTLSSGYCTLFTFSVGKNRWRGGGGGNNNLVWITGMFQAGHKLIFKNVISFGNFIFHFSFVIFLNSAKVQLCFVMVWLRLQQLWLMRPSMAAETR